MRLIRVVVLTAILIAIAAKAGGNTQTRVAAEIVISAGALIVTYHHRIVSQRGRLG